jgi:UDP-GlcNAc:undecaprenyl-phosphate/decaprenyl-phosphate GlcNAc-1-phosphate transferase
MEVFAHNIILAFSAMVAAFLISCISIYLIIRLSHHLELFDAPDERKIHTEKISRLGGIGIFLGFVFSVGISPFILGLWLKEPFLVYAKILPKILFILPTLLIFLVGVFDDFFQVKARWKLLIQIAAALIVMIAGARIEALTIPFTDKTIQFGIWSWLISFVWIIGATNSMNLIDGMDGLSATIGGIAFAVYGLIFLLSNHFMLAIVSLVLVGTLMGYMMFNFPPARIFMGDSGSLVMGFLLAVLPLVAEPESGTTLYLPVTLLIIPIIDVFSAIFRRVRRRVSFTTPDKEHIHHKLLAIGMKERFILMVVSSVMFLASIPLVISTIIPFDQVVFYILLTWAVVLAGFVLLRFLYRKKQV